jgi:hypothetical protein
VIECDGYISQIAGQTGVRLQHTTIIDDTKIRLPIMFAHQPIATPRKLEKSSRRGKMTKTAAWRIFDMAAD